MNNYAGFFISEKAKKTAKSPTHALRCLIGDRPFDLCLTSLFSVRLHSHNNTSLKKRPVTNCFSTHNQHKGENAKTTNHAFIKYDGILC